MATKKGINISGTYIVHHRLYEVCHFYTCTLYSKKLKGRTESYFILFFKLNDHPARYFIFGLRQIHP